MLRSSQFYIQEDIKQIQTKAVADWQSDGLASSTIQIKLYCMVWGGHAECQRKGSIFSNPSCSICVSGPKESQDPCACQLVSIPLWGLSTEHASGTEGSSISLFKDTHHQQKRGTLPDSHNPGCYPLPVTASTLEGLT